MNNILSILTLLLVSCFRSNNPTYKDYQSSHITTEDPGYIECKMLDEKRLILLIGTMEIFPTALLYGNDKSPIFEELEKLEANTLIKKTIYENLKKEIGLSHESQILLNIMTFPLVICIKVDKNTLPFDNNTIKETDVYSRSLLRNIGKFTHHVIIEALQLKFFLEKNFGKLIKKESLNFFHYYLLKLCTTSLWLQNHPSLLQLPENVRDIISDGRYIKAADHYFKDLNAIDEKEYARQIIEYREKSDSDRVEYDMNEGARKFGLLFSFEEVQKMAYDSGISGIVYVITEGENLNPIFIISKPDKERLKEEK